MNTFSTLGRSTVARMLILAATVAVWLLFHVVWIPGTTFDATRLILYDQGTFLYAVERWFAGERLFADFTWQYGPLALGWYALAAGIAGNSAVTLVGASGLATGLAWSGLVLLIARKTGFGWAWLGGVMLLLPAMTGPCLLSLYTGPHAAVEALALVGVAWWVSYHGRPSFGNGIQLGFLLGGLLLVRFGPHVVAGLVVFLLWLLAERSEWAAWRRLGVAMAGTAMSSVACWIGYATWLWLRLSPDAWRDQVWPTYIVDAYREAFASRWPDFTIGSDWATKWGPVLVIGGVLAITMGKLKAWRISSDPAEPGRFAGIVFLPLNFFVGSLFMFHVSAWPHANAWMVWPAIGLIAYWPALRWRGLVLAACLPAVLIQGAGWVTRWQADRDLHAARMVLPNGQALWFHGGEAGYFTSLATYIRDHPKPLAPGERRKVVVFLAGAGVHFYFNTDRVGRHIWYLFQFVRPWEYDQVVRDLCAHELFLPLWAVDDKRSTTMNGEIHPWIWMPLPPEKAGIFISHLRNGEKVRGIGLAYEIAPEPVAPPKH